jgi:hypothetical protein
MSLGLIALIVTLLWIVSLAIYIYVSRQHRDIQDGVESLQKSLGDRHSEEE